MAFRWVRVGRMPRRSAATTPTLEHRKRPARFGPKDVTPVSKRSFGGAGDA